MLGVKERREVAGRPGRRWLGEGCGVGAFLLSHTENRPSHFLLGPQEPPALPSCSFPGARQCFPVVVTPVWQPPHQARGTLAEDEPIGGPLPSDLLQRVPQESQCTVCQKPGGAGCPSLGAVQEGPQRRGQGLRPERREEPAGRDPGSFTQEGGHWPQPGWVEPTCPLSWKALSPRAWESQRGAAQPCPWC